MARRTRSEALATRESILDAAAWCFRTLGVSATTMAAIAQRAGCTRGAIYGHFPEQPDILRAVLERDRPRLREGLDAVVRARPPVLDALRGCLRRFLSETAADEYARGALEIAFHRCDFAGTAASAFGPMRREQMLTHDALRRVLERAERLGELREGLRGQACARLLHSVLVGALKFDMVQSPGGAPGSGMAAALDLVLGLIRAREPLEEPPFSIPYRKEPSMSHTLKDIAVFFDASGSGLNVLDAAARLAHAQSAHLIGISCAADQDGVSSTSFARGNAVHEVIQRQQQSVAVQLLHAGRALAEAATRYGLQVEFRIIPYTQSGAEAALHSLYCDLLVAGNPAVGTPLIWSAMQVLERTGMPLLIVPQGWGGAAIGSRIVLAWNASRQARRAIADALPLMMAADAVDVLVVDPVSDEGGHGENPGADIAAYLARHHVTVEVVHAASLGQPVADAILREAAARGADLVVFGAYSRPRISEAIFGGVTRTLLDSQQLPLFISR